MDDFFSAYSDRTLARHSLNNGETKSTKHQKPGNRNFSSVDRCIISTKDFDWGSITNSDVKQNFQLQSTLITKTSCLSLYRIN